MFVGELARQVPLLHLEDSLGKAAEQLRRSSLPALPVVENGTIVGMVHEEDVFQLSWSSKDQDGSSPPSVAELMRTDLTSIGADLPMPAAVEAFRHMEVPVLPVVDINGRFRGLICRADVASALCKTLRPSRIGGMATPLGVHLTTGNLRAGVGDFALALTGIFMGLFTLAAQFLTALLLGLFDAFTGSDLMRQFWEWRYTGGQVVTSNEWLFTGLCGFIFFALMRLMPLTGYHGAEHQVVHAIERGEGLEPHIVSKMPLVHPRCGTNLVALIVFLMVLWIARPDALTGVVFTLVICLTWRRLGMLLQHLFTTKKPSRKQLESAIRAGKELLERHQQNLSYQATIPRLIWNMGFVQVILGFAVMYGLSELVMVLLEKAII